MTSSLKALHGDFLEHLEIAQGRSAKTVENYDRYLRRFYDQQHVDSVAGITTNAIQAFRRHLNNVFEVSPATQNYHLIALRQFLKYLVQRDIPALAPSKVGLAKIAERDIDVLYPEEVDALLTAPSQLLSQESDLHKQASLLRDAALLSILFSTGMRISEAIHLNRDDIRDDSDELPVRGKGNKIRIVFLSESARNALAEYLRIRTDTDPALFVRHKKGSVGDLDDLRITARSAQRNMKKYAAQAGITKPVTPHTLRHSFATDLLSNGADVRQVQQLLGHSSITTTQVYTHLTDTHLREVHERFHRRRKN